MSFVDERVFTEVLVRVVADAAVVDSITDEWVFFEGIGAGVGALLIFATASTGLLAATAAFGFACAEAATFTFVADFADFAAAAGLEDAGAFFTAAFVATGFLATGVFATAFFATAFFATAFFATGFLSTDLDLAAAFTLEATAFTSVFAFAFVAGLARAVALPDLAADWVLFVDFAISILTL